VEHAPRRSRHWGTLGETSALGAAARPFRPRRAHAPCRFDGSTLDVDLTQPAPGTGSTHPLIIMLHGFGNNKHEWESTTNEGDGADKWHWNNHWFAEHGYYVLTYTARGFRDDGAYAPYQPPTPSGAPNGSVDAPNGTLPVKSRDYEIRDTQWLAALVAATYSDLNTSQVAVTGGSYGGGESWMQASQAQWTFPHSQDPTLPVLDLQVGCPQVPLDRPGLFPGATPSPFPTT
jgi:pimeloyl-ACP methyl ester carboxylesterase